MRITRCAICCSAWSGFIGEARPIAVAGVDG
jgi:hypothetical protein